MNLVQRFLCTAAHTPPLLPLMPKGHSPLENSGQSTAWETGIGAGAVTCPTVEDPGLGGNTVSLSVDTDIAASLSTTSSRVDGAGVVSRGATAGVVPVTGCLADFLLTGLCWPPGVKTVIIW